MPSLRKDREANVATLTQDIEGVQGLVVAGYTSVKTPELNELRGKLRPLQGQCRVVKNTLAKIAFKNRGIDGFGDFFEGQCALTIVRGDAIAGFKVMVDFAKTHENFKIRAGYMDGKVLPAGEMNAIASLPPRHVLLAQMLGQLQSPLSGLHHVMSAGVRNLAYAFSQVASAKEKAGAA